MRILDETWLKSSKCQNYLSRYSEINEKNACSSFCEHALWRLRAAIVVTVGGAVVLSGLRSWSRCVEVGSDVRQWLSKGGGGRGKECGGCGFWWLASGLVVKRSEWFLKLVFFVCVDRVAK